MYMPLSKFSSAIFGIGVAVLCLAQLVVSAPRPAPTDVGICVDYTYNAYDEVQKCLKNYSPDSKTCQARVTGCIKSTCGLYVASS